jgi:L-malate glycosyltransferase
MNGMSEPIRVGLFIDRFDPGGTQRQFLEVLRGLDRSRFSPHVACFDAEGAWFARVRDLDVPVAVFPIRGFARPEAGRALYAFRRWCTERRLSMVHTWEIYSNIFGLSGAILAGVPVRIGSRRGLNPDRRRGLRLMQRMAYTTAHLVVANSDAAGRQLRVEGVRASKIVVARNGLDLDAFGARTYRQRPRRILMTAGLRPIKGLDVLVQAAAHITAKVRDVEFIIVGEGPDREPALRQARDLGVADRFSFLGHREDVPALLSSADIFVLPSRSEAFPNAVLEAMAAGLPVVASAVGGIPEVVADGHTGRLVPPDDPSALARALVGMMNDPGGAAALGQAGRRVVEEQYSLPAMIARFEQLYVSALASQARARGDHFGTTVVSRVTGPGDVVK